MDDLPTPEDPSSAPVRPTPDARARARATPGAGIVDGMDLDRRRERADLIDRHLRILHEISLVQDDDRGGAALQGDREVAFEPARIEVVIEAADQEHGVDVRGDDLLLGGIARRASRETAEPRQHGLDARVRRRRGGGSTATQSPTPGKSARADA